MIMLVFIPYKLITNVWKQLKHLRLFWHRSTDVWKKGRGGCNEPVNAVLEPTQVNGAAQTKSAAVCRMEEAEAEDGRRRGLDTICDEASHHFSADDLFKNSTIGRGKH